LSVGLFASCVSHNEYSPETDDLTIYLVRHSEKTQQKPDPGLTQAGLQRSLDLLATLKNRDITHIHSSNYLRTKATAKPSAEYFNIKIRLYDAHDLTSIANTLKNSTGTHLVVGHSNTTPQLVELLGAEPGSEINEASEYDRLYKVVIKGEHISSELKRYGKKYYR